MKKLKYLTIFYLCIISLMASLNIHANELRLETLDRYLVDSESNYPDIVDGAQKYVRWHKGEIKKTEFAIVYLHGFSASRQELSPTTENLADQIGANAFYTRLTGHGRSDDAMAQATVEQWQTDTLEAYQIGQLIGDKVILVSTSTGGTLATWLLAQDTIKQPFTNIMISPNYAVQNSSTWLLKSTLGLKIAKFINGDYNSFTPISEAHGQYWTERYPLEAVQPMLELLDDVEELDKSNIKAPQLIVYSPKDRVIDIDEILEVNKQFTNSQTTLLAFNNSTDPYQHVLSGNACSPDSTESMTAVLSTYTKTLIEMKE